ncbi:hypothetical protein [Streptomyces sp. NPDC003635]
MATTWKTSVRSGSDRQPLLNPEAGAADVVAVRACLAVPVVPPLPRKRQTVADLAQRWVARDVVQILPDRESAGKRYSVSII